MEGYSVVIEESSKKLSAKERISLKDTSMCVSLDEATSAGEVVLNPVTMWAVLDVHNDRSENPDYRVFLLEGSDGTRYKTGSESFWNSFRNIEREMSSEENPEPWGIRCVRIASKNYKGKTFLSCVIV